MKKLFTFLFSAFICAMAMGQAPTAILKKATVAPVIDGTIDAVWADAPENPINLTYTGETPTVGPAGTTWWKGLWDDKGIYLLLNVNDNVWSPAFGAANAYLYDHPEIYFDVNYNLKDGKGPQTDGNGLGNGHHQFAPNPIKDSISGGVASSTSCNGGRFSYNVTDPTYVVEYFIPFTRLLDSDGIMVDKTNTIGFDVTIADNDVPAPGVGIRNRQVWSNIGTIAESWVNMDDCGTITLEGATSLIYVDVITVNPVSITTNKGAVQLTASVSPADATNQMLKWTEVDGTGRASITSAGLLTPMTNGTVTVVASSTDGGWAQSDPITINISGQVLDKNDIWNTFNLVKNWNFNTDISSWGGWWDGATQIPPVVQDGVVVMSTDVNADGADYHYQFNQAGLFTALPNIPYTVKFKSWSSETRTNTLDFEDTAGNNYTRYGASTDPGNVGGTSEWAYTTTTDPTWFTFHVTFDKIIPTTVQKIQWLESMSTSTVYLDSVLLISDADMALIPSAVKSLASDINFRVSPNPVVPGSLLTVDKLASTIKNVSIYNAIGQKMMEKIPTGNMAKFDVSSLEKGMYLVKLSDGSSQKFIR